MRSKVRIVLAISFAIILTACGGGGSGDVVPTAFTLSGAAVKGPLSDAVINIYKTTAEGTQGERLTSVTTDPAGKYSATVSGYSGVVILEASVKSETRMFDEATGVKITPSIEFKMRSSLAVKFGDTAHAEINPFTESATANALMKTGGLTTNNVGKANMDIATILQFNPLTTIAEFDAATGNAKNSAAAALTAVSYMAMSGALGCTAGNQATKVACITVAISSRGLTDSALKSDLQSNINSVVSNLGLPALTLQAPSGAVVDDATPLELTKSFIGTLRSNLKALSATDISLQTELQAVADDMKNRTLPIAGANVDALRVAFAGAQFWNDVVKNGTTPFTSTKTYYFGGNGPSRCTLYNDTELQTVASERNTANYVSCYGPKEYIPATDENGFSTYCAAAGEWCSSNIGINIKLDPDSSDSNKFAVFTRTSLQKITLKSVSPNSYNYEYTVYGASGSGNISVLTIQVNAGGGIGSISIFGELSPAFNVNWSGYVFAGGGANPSLYYPGVSVKILGDKQNVALSAALTKVAGMDNLAISGAMELIKAGELESHIEISSGSYLKAKSDGVGGYSAKDGSQELLIKIKGGTAGNTITGDLKIGSFKSDASLTSYVPTIFSFSGSVQRNGISFFDGALTSKIRNYDSFNQSLAVSESNKRIEEFGFVGSVIIQNRPVLNLTMSTILTKAGIGIQLTDAIGQYRQGLLVVNFSGRSDSENNIATLESTGGVRLVIDKSKSTYKLTKNGTVTGDFSPVTNVMTYSDSSYEQF
jgi:hypothetical protein